MPITELVFPRFKTDVQSQAGLNTVFPQIQEVFTSGIDGLHVFYHGPVIEEDGVAVENTSGKALYALEWRDAPAFHAFFPASGKFQDFVKLVTPFAAAKSSPELYEAPTRATSSLATPVTQVIKAKASKETKEAWKKLESNLQKHAEDETSIYHADGIEKDEGVFLGLIGWKSMQAYERVGKQKSIRDQILELGNGGEVHDFVVPFVAMSKP